MATEEGPLWKDIKESARSNDDFTFVKALFALRLRGVPLLVIIAFAAAAAGVAVKP